MSFVNPYTFIGLPEKVERRLALGHAPSRAAAESRYTGTLKVRWSIKTPIAMPTTPTAGGDREGLWGEPAGQVVIPGASAKGAVRSVHEALFAGCPRVVDENFTPVYRDLLAGAQGDAWRLAVVVSAPGAALSVRTCGRNDPVNARMLKSNYVAVDAARQPGTEPLGLPRTGDFVRPGPEVPQHLRGQLVRTTRDGATKVLRPDREAHATFLRQLDAAAADRLAVIMVTDTATRPDNACFWSSASIGRGSDLPVPAPVVKRFHRALAGARDMQPGAPSAGDFVDVPFPPESNATPAGPPIGQRRPATNALRFGDVVWVRLEGEAIAELKLSVAWRTPADGNEMRDRLTVHSCETITDEKVQLCLSCQVFGSADDDSGQDKGRQAGYAGHVRFGDVVLKQWTPKAEDRAVMLAPLSSPHPGAGMYYLERRDIDQPSAGLTGLQPSRWGSYLDKPPPQTRKPRRLRGRKFYWHADPEEQVDRLPANVPEDRRKARHLKRPHHAAQLCSTVHLIRQGPLRQTITFDGLDELSLVSLLAALEPHRLLGRDAQAWATHLGGAKPLGLGSVQATVTDLQMTTTSDRYSDEPKTLDLAWLDARSTPAFQDRCGDLTALHRDAQKVLALDGLGGQQHLVSYPTVQPWSAYGMESFDLAYEYFGKNNGQVRREGTPPNYTYRASPYGQLPATTNQNQQAQ